MNEAPKVTVFIPVYNRERYVGVAIDSILAQSFGDFELLVVDDGSTDGSVALIEAYRDPRVRLERNGRNLGIPKTRNRGLELARGEYLAILDSDDAAYPDRLAKQVAFLDAHPDFAMLGSWGRAMDPSGRPLRRIKKQPVSSAEVKAHLLFRCCINNRSVMGRTAVMQAYGYHNDFPRCQDYELLVRLAANYRLGNLPEVLVLGRTHDQQITGQTFDLGQTKKQEIASTQLTALGVPHDQDDLARHAILGRMGKLDYTPNRTFLDWAEHWLYQLQAANRSARIYPEPAFTRVLGAYWLKACHRTSRHIGWDAWRRLLGSPLRRNATASLVHGLVGVRQPR